MQLDTRDDPTVACVTRIAVHLPVGRLTNADLLHEHPDWDVDRVSAKTGVYARSIAPPDVTACDLAVAAGQALFDLDPIARGRIGMLIVCTQTPDYFFPSTSCIVQDRLGLPTEVGALDLGLGCSGHVYGLSLAKALVESRQVRSVLLITADTYSHIIDPDDRSVRSLFGDGAAATLIEPSGHAGASGGSMTGFTFGSDGSGRDSLILRGGGFRDRLSRGVDRSSNDDYIYMNGPDVFNFTRERVPQAVKRTLEAAELQAEDIALYVFHQASRIVIEALCRALEIPDEKCWFGVGQIGNTVSSTIPIALAQASTAGRLRPGDKVIVAGFGVGLSWACAVMTWDEEYIGTTIS